jgi:hypothetical protein
VGCRIPPAVHPALVAVLHLSLLPGVLRGEFACRAVRKPVAKQAATRLAGLSSNVPEAVLRLLVLASNALHEAGSRAWHCVIIVMIA